MAASIPSADWSFSKRRPRPNSWRAARPASDASRRCVGRLQPATASRAKTHRARTCSSICSTLARARAPPSNEETPTASGELRLGERPYTLVAELSYRCPLGSRVLLESGGRSAAGASSPPRPGAESSEKPRRSECLQVQPHGRREPLMRDDLEITGCCGARGWSLSANLISSGIPADGERLARGRWADSLQLSVQDVDPMGAA